MTDFDSLFDTWFKDLDGEPEENEIPEEVFRAIKEEHEEEE